MTFDGSKPRLRSGGRPVRDWPDVEAIQHATAGTPFERRALVRCAESTTVVARATSGEPHVTGGGRGHGLKLEGWAVACKANGVRI